MQAVLDRIDTVSSKPQKNSPIRVTDEAIKWARIASGYTGEAMSEYVSRIIIERGQADTERLHGEVLSQAHPVKAQTRKPKGN